MALTSEGINNVVDLVKFEDNDIDNVVQNLRQPQDIFHAEISACLGREEVFMFQQSLFNLVLVHEPRNKLLWY